MTSPLIICGAPRSGSSIIAEALHSAGMWLGEQFGLADNTGSHGHLRDRRLVQLHQSAMQEVGFLPTDSTTWASDPSTAASFGHGADKFLEECPGDGPWGLKDWQSLLFLDAWNQRLPNARWVFVLRRPAEFAWSYAAGPPPRTNRRVTAAQALEFWLFCNRRILEFTKSHADRCTVLLVPDDLGKGTGTLAARSDKEWQNLLSRISLSSHYNRYLFRDSAPRWLQRQVSSNREIQTLWQALQNHRAVPGDVKITREPPKPDPGRQRVTVISSYRQAFSEAFVQAHINDLPANVDWIIQDRDGRKFDANEISLLSVFDQTRAGFLNALGYGGNDIENRAFERYLRRNDIKAVLAEFAPNAVKVMDSCRRVGVPLIAHFHGYDATVNSVLKDMQSDYLQLFEQASACIAVSRDMEQRLVSLGASADKVHYNPCSVDLDAFGGADPGNAPPHFLSFGRFVDKKAPHLTLLAFKQVLAACPQARLIMVGDGDLKGVCIDLVHHLELGQFVDMVGFLPHSAIAGLMRKARGFVQHSVTARDGNSEGTPVGLLEASASGLPVLSTFHHGIKEAVQHEQTGFLVQPHDVNGMAEYWIELASDPGLCSRMGVAGRDHVHHSPFDRKVSMANLWRIIEDSISRNQ